MRSGPHGGPTSAYKLSGSLIIFLASDPAGNLTGANYLIDGGLIKTT